MSGYNSRRRPHFRPIKDQVRPKTGKSASKLPGVILFAAVIGVFPVAYALEWLMGAGWLVSALGAIAVSAGLALGAVMLIDR